MLSLLLIIIVVFLSYILQTSVFSYFQISGVSPDVLLVPIIFVAYTKGQNKGMLTAFLSGLLLDLLFTGNIGVSAIIYVVIAFFSGYTYRIYSRNDFFIPLSLIVVGEFIYSFLYYVFGFFLAGRLELSTYMNYVIIPRVIYTALIAIPVYMLLWVVQAGINKLK